MTIVDEEGMTKHSIKLDEKLGATVNLFYKMTFIDGVCHAT